MKTIPEKIIQHSKQEGIAERTGSAYLRSWLNPKSRADAIRAKCIECQGFENVVPRIKQCGIEICPLHKVRPYKMRSF